MIQEDSTFKSAVLLCFRVAFLFKCSILYVMHLNRAGERERAGACRSTEVTRVGGRHEKKGVEGETSLLANGRAIYSPSELKTTQ